MVLSRFDSFQPFCSFSESWLNAACDRAKGDQMDFITHCPLSKACSCPAVATSPGWAVCVWCWAPWGQPLGCLGRIHRQCVQAVLHSVRPAGAEKPEVAQRLARWSDGGQEQVVPTHPT